MFADEPARRQSKRQWLVKDTGMLVPGRPTLTSPRLCVTDRGSIDRSIVVLTKSFRDAGCIVNSMSFRKFRAASQLP